MSRLSDLAAVATAAEVFALPGQARELTGELLGCIAIKLIDSHRLVFRSGHVKPRVDVAGAVDWARVKRVKIIGLDNDHA
ncbi:hypothetical protein [Chitinivorax sp. B]|uniref:hypothetical protein n=1 Tax=Chitinivorax sp. B TaxID=2502235 RepID=UPI00148502CF|nr:hypothetical protein [Chitinivorax sp. B]